MGLARRARYRLVGVSDGNNHSTSLAYNSAGYLSSITYPGNTGGNADKIQFTSYDADGNVLVFGSTKP